MYGFGRLNTEILEPRIDPPEVDWCDECDEDAMFCACSEDDPDKAYDEKRERMMENDDY